MKYALLGYDLDATLDQLAPEDKRAVHQGHAALGERSLGDEVRLIAHYRFRPPALATTIRIGTDGAIRRQGAASKETATLRALYILESDDPDQAAQLAEQLSATMRGATIEIWPLSEPHASH